MTCRQSTCARLSSPLTEMEVRERERGGGGRERERGGGGGVLLCFRHSDDVHSNTHLRLSPDKSLQVGPADLLLREGTRELPPPVPLVM